MSGAHLARRADFRYLIIGGGMACDAAARGIRQLDADGSIGIIADEEDPPAIRPALTKKLWTDPEFTFDRVWLHTEEQTGAYRRGRERAQELNRSDRVVLTSSGAEYGYQHLLIATGASPRRIDLPDDERIIYFRSAEDYRRLRALCDHGRRIAVVGGGFIGTELAAALVHNGIDTTLVFPEPTLCGAVFPTRLAERFQHLFATAGVRLIPNTVVEHGTADAAAVTLLLDESGEVDADAVVLGLGVAPNSAIAEHAGLRINGGIVVDDRLRTDDDNVWAAGDVASYPDRILGRTRVEHVDNARAMGTQAGRNLAGADEPYDHTPYFYSVVFGNRYEAVGRLDSSLQTVEHWSDDDAGVVYYLDGDRVAGVLLWNVHGQLDAARATIAQGATIRLDDLAARIPLTPDRRSAA
ncbi:MAG TPA: FAD-dependent oxidoreductase [Humibacter sp.]|nr:FAD-dependent oxidoreductase [Humibacter sp.]